MNVWLFLLLKIQMWTIWCFKWVTNPLLLYHVKLCCTILLIKLHECLAGKMLTFSMKILTSVISLSNFLLAAGDTIQIDDTTIYSIGPRVKTFSDWLLQVMVLGNLETIFPAATREYAPFVEELWNDAAIQATYGRRNELEMLPRAAAYFLDRVRHALSSLSLVSKT